MNINIYMFKDHLIYSNNLQDAFYQARVYQQQMLNEEKKKTDLKVLTQIVEELNKTIHLIENNQIQLNEADWRRYLGRLFSAADNEADDLVRAAQERASRRPAINIFNIDSLPPALRAMLGQNGVPSFWNGKWWVVDPKTTETYYRVANKDGTFTWKLWKGKDGFWGETDRTGRLVNRDLKPRNAEPGQKGNQGNNIPQFFGIGVAGGAIGSGALSSPEPDDWDTGPGGDTPPYVP